MNNIIEKFSLYDLFGVYLPGAFMVFILDAFAGVYSSFGETAGILGNIINVIQKCPDGLKYTLIAYFVGILIHEIGKYISTRLNLFESEKLQKWILGDEKLNKWHLPIIRKIVKHNHDALIGSLLDKNALNDVSFEKALNHVRYSAVNKTSRASQYHHLYGLTRGLALDILLEIIIAILLVVFGFLSIKLFLPILLASILIFLTLYCRAYRYSMSWIKNIYLQYAYDNHLAG